jgi:hypothetical protein
MKTKVNCELFHSGAVEYYFISGFNWIKRFHATTEIQRMDRIKYCFMAIVLKFNVSWPHLNNPVCMYICIYIYIHTYIVEEEYTTQFPLNASIWILKPKCRQRILACTVPGSWIFAKADFSMRHLSNTVSKYGTVSSIMLFSVYFRNVFIYLLFIYFKTLSVVTIYDRFIN